MKIGIESNLVRYLLKNAYFITGTAYAGKSTMVRLLAQRHDGIFCGENYHDRLMDAVDPIRQPNLAYLRDMRDWQQFIHRTPEAYSAWLDGCAREASEMEILLLVRLTAEGRKVFVDTNISPKILSEISSERRVLVMLSPQSMSVERFFDRTDPEKQFLLRQIEQAPDPDAAMRNFRACVALANSPEAYDALKNSGFVTLLRDDSRTIEETLALIERHFELSYGGIPMPDIKHTQAKRLYDSVNAVAGTEQADALLSRLPLSKTPSEKQKAAWARASCAALSDQFDEKTVETIRKGCRCHPSPAQVKNLKKLWEGSADAEEFARKATETSDGAFVIEARGDALVLLYPRCYCAFVKHSDERPPKEWCACSLGYAEEMFSAVTSRPACATLEKSVARGDGRCEIAVRFP